MGSCVYRESTVVLGEMVRHIEGRLYDGRLRCVIEEMPSCRYGAVGNGVKGDSVLNVRVEVCLMNLLMVALMLNGK